MRSAASLLPLLCAVLAAETPSKYGPLETVYEWVRLDFDWATPEARAAAVDSKRYDPENCLLSDVKAVDGEVFVTVPRLRHGVPASVNRVVARGGEAVLSPYPSWELNTPGDGCQGIQNAFSVEIDPLRRMWIVDSGSRDLYTQPNNACPPKILVWDMVKEREVRRFAFPREIVAQASVMLRDVVLDTSDDDPEDWFAYVADTSRRQILVYSWREDAAWNVTHATMDHDSGAISFAVGDDDPRTFPVAIDSLALSPRGAANHRLFFAVMASFSFHSIPTAFLRNRTEVALASAAELDSKITQIGTRQSQSEGMTVSDSGVMFYNVISDSAVNQWNISAPFSAMNEVFQEPARLQWPDSFGWDDGFLYITANNFHKFAWKDLEPDKVAFRLMRARVDMDGYMGPYRRGRRVGAAGAAPPRATAAATALLLAAIVSAAV